MTAANLMLTKVAERSAVYLQSTYRGIAASASEKLAGSGLTNGAGVAFRPSRRARRRVAGRSS